MDQVKKTFSCSYADLLKVATAILDSLLEKISNFETLVPGFYTKDYTDRCAKSIADAKNEPVSNDRTQQRELARAALHALAKSAREAASRLARNIARAYKGDELRIHEKVVAKNRSANEEDWQAMSDLLKSMDLFLDANKAILETQGFMPKAMPGEIKTLRANYEAKKTEFEAFDTSLPIVTKRNREQYNAIYDWVRLACDDGQALYANDPDNRTAFVFDDVLSRVSNPGIGGIRVTLTNAQTKLPIENAEFSIVGREGKLLTNNKGVAQYKQVASGMYDLRFSHPDYKLSLMEDHTVEPGVLGRVVLSLSPLVPLASEEVEVVLAEAKRGALARKGRKKVAAAEFVAVASGERLVEMPPADLGDSIEKEVRNEKMNSDSSK